MHCAERNPAGVRHKDDSANERTVISAADVCQYCAGPNMFCHERFEIPQPCERVTDQLRCCVPRVVVSPSAYEDLDDLDSRPAWVVFGVVVLCKIRKGLVKQGVCPFNFYESKSNSVPRATAHG